MFVVFREAVDRVVVESQLARMLGERSEFVVAIRFEGSVSVKPIAGSAGIRHYGFPFNALVVSASELSCEGVDSSGIDDLDFLGLVEELRVHAGGFTFIFAFSIFWIFIFNYDLLN